MRNTKKKGQIRVVVFPSKSKDSSHKYTAACIDFAIVREGNDALELYKEVLNIAINYLINIQKNNLNDKLLNQTLPKKYINEYNKSQKSTKKIDKPIKSPIALSELRPWQNRVTA